MTGPNNDGTPPVDVVYQEALEVFEMKNHNHNCYEMIFISEGAAEFKINNKTYRAEANDLLFINHLESHEMKVLSTPYKRCFVLISLDFLHTSIKEPVLLSVFKYRPAHFKHILKIKPEDTAFISGLLSNMHREIKEMGALWQNSLESFMKTLVIYLYRNYPGYFPALVPDNATKTINTIQEYIERHFDEEIRLDDLSKKYYTSMHYLSHTFKNKTGYTFKEYLILQRLSKAKDLLYHDSDDILQVGLKSGFNNVNHFIRIFKKYTGTTPLQYRKMLFK